MSALMTLVTIDAVVDVARYVRVPKVVRIVAAVTSGALEHRIII